MAKLRAVDLGSFLAVHARGRGTAVAMRTAILGQAFDHLGAVAATSCARVDNAPSLAVSRRLGYIENGVFGARWVHSRSDWRRIHQPSIDDHGASD